MATTNIIILFWPLKYSATRNGLLAPYIPPRDKVDHNVIGKKILCTITVLLLHSPFFSQCYCNCNVQFFYSPTTIEKKSLDKSLSRTFIKYFVAVISVANYCYLFSLQIYVAKTFFEKMPKLATLMAVVKYLVSKYYNWFGI